MACEGCPIDCSLRLAEEILRDNPDDAFDESTMGKKLSQLAVTKAVFEKASTDCNDVVEGGNRKSCGVERAVNDTLGLLLNKTGIDLYNRIAKKQIGFN